MKTITLISIIICKYKCTEFLKECKKCLDGQEFKDFETIIIDNDTNNKGFAKGMNEGVKMAKGEWVICLNPDVTFKKDFLQKIANKIKEVNNKVGNISVKELDKDGKVRHYGSYLSLCRHPLMLKEPNKKKLFCSQGGCQIYKKQAFIEAKGYDEDYFLYGEDTDLSWKIKDIGYKIEPCWEAEFKHYNFGSETDKRISVYYSHRNILTTIRKHNTNWQIIKYLLFIIGGQIMCFVINPKNMKTVLKAKIDCIKGIKGGNYTPTKIKKYEGKK